MYLYFDSNGTLKECINDTALRKGNSDINSLYIYWEGYSDSITNVYTRFKLDDDSVYPTSTTYYNDYEEEDGYIEYNSQRDLKYFVYGQSFHFYRVDLPDEVLSVGGLVECSIWFVTSSTITTMGLITFNVEESTASVEIDENINIAQWNALIKAYTTPSFYVVDSLDNLLYPDNTIVLYNGELYQITDQVAEEFTLTEYIKNGTSEDVAFNGNIYYTNNIVMYGDSSNEQLVIDLNGDNSLNIVNGYGFKYNGENVVTEGTYTTIYNTRITLEATTSGTLTSSSATLTTTITSAMAGKKIRITYNVGSGDSTQEFVAYGYITSNALCHISFNGWSAALCSCSVIISSNSLSFYVMTICDTPYAGQSNVNLLKVELEQ